MGQNECTYFLGDKSTNFYLNLNNLYKRNIVNNECTEISFKEINEKKYS